MNNRGATVFGAADGLTLILGLVLGLAVSSQPGLSVWHAALSGGLAEFGGMALGQYWADPKRDKVAALCNGLAACVVVVACGVPFACMARGPATGIAGIMIVLFGLAVTWLRAETGWSALFKTFALLAAAAALSVVANLL
jgi:hypothetical protein